MLLAGLQALAAGGGAYTPVERSFSSGSQQDRLAGSEPSPRAVFGSVLRLLALQTLWRMRSIDLRRSLLAGRRRSGQVVARALRSIALAVLGASRTAWQGLNPLLALLSELCSPSGASHALDWRSIDARQSLLGARRRSRRMAAGALRSIALAVLGASRPAWQGQNPLLARFLELCSPSRASDPLANALDRRAPVVSRRSDSRRSFLSIAMARPPIGTRPLVSFGRRPPH